MGRPPAVVIVARHGARLDAADKQWHLTSPTPYDPPLTYGGWTQCRALGARIASLLQAREEFSEAEDDQQPSKEGHKELRNGGSSRRPGSQAPKRRKKHKVIIHSSPFLRCIQTSVAISAGISQYRGQAGTAQEDNTTTSIRSGSSAVPPKTHPDLTNSPVLTAIPDEHAGHGFSHDGSIANHPHLKPRLRIDAFLGEWLSPDYYENITPPPASVMMVAGAKADLLRRGEYVDTSEDPSRLASTKGHFPGGWGHKSGDSRPTNGDAVQKLSEDAASMSLDTSRRDRASTATSNTSIPKWQKEDGHALRASATTASYAPPIPRYAISPSDPIPSGYVNHARDACIEVDYQWDSMRPPQDWGDGGDYGEEWSHMHKRFRRGLQGMIAWYRLHHETANQLGGHQRVLHPHPHEEDDEDTDTVLVLVTHGAGCNALIGALTNQPVLLDVSMASLTMAIRREDHSRPATPKSGRQSPSSPMSPYTRYMHDHPLSADYTVQLTASTDHLRAASASQPLSVPLLTGRQQPHHSSSQSQPNNVLADAPGPRVVPRRNRFDTMPSKPIAPANSALFSPPESPVGVQRSASAAVRGNTSGGLGRSNSGLWSKPGSGTDAPARRTWTMSSASSDGDTTGERAKPPMSDPLSNTTLNPTTNPTSTPTSNPASNGTSMWAQNPASAMQGNTTPPRPPRLHALHDPLSPLHALQPNFPGAPMPPPPLPSPASEANPASLASLMEREDVLSPLGGGGGLWGGGGGGGGGTSGLWGASGGSGNTKMPAGVMKGLPKKGMSAMAMALRGGPGSVLGSGPEMGKETEEDRQKEKETDRERERDMAGDDEITERERGLKRRWTVNEREMLG